MLCSSPILRLSIAETSCAAVDLAFSGVPGYDGNRLRHRRCAHWPGLQEEPSLAISLIVTIGTLIFFLLVGFFGPGIHLDAKSLSYGILIGILIGILFALGNVIYYKALSIDPMGTVSVTCSLAPLLPFGF